MTDFLSGFTLDTTTFMAAAGILATAYGAIWAVKRVIALIRG